MRKGSKKAILSWGLPCVLMAVVIFIYRNQSLWIYPEGMARSINWNGVFSWIASTICLVPAMAFIIRKIWEFLFEREWKKFIAFLEKCGKADNLKRIVKDVLLVMLIFGASCGVDFVYEKIAGENSIGSSLVSYRVLFFFGVGIMGYVLWQVYKERIRRIEVAVAITIVCMGSMMALGLPAQLGISWDDKVHYANMKQYSYLWEYQLSESENELIENSREGDTYIEYQLSEIENNRENLDSRHNQVVLNQEVYRGNLYQSIVYLPSAIVHAICRYVGMSFLCSFVLGRWINVFVYAMIVYQAVKRLKSGKLILAAIALFPTELFQASNYNYDFWVNGFAFLGVASIIGILQEPSRKISWKDTVIIFWAFLIGFGPKAIYFPLLLLCFLINKGQFKTKKDCWICRGMVIGTMLLMMCSFVVPFLTAGVGGNDMRGGSDVNSLEQIRFILTQPFSYAKILYNFLRFYVSCEVFPYYATCLGYLTHPNPGRYGLELLLFFVVVVVTDRRKEDRPLLSWKNRWWVLIVNIGIVCLVVTAMYVAFTAVGAPTVNGCQARYLYPILFPVVYFCGSSKVEFIWKKNAYVSVISAISVLFIAYEMWSCCIQGYF